MFQFLYELIIDPLGLPIDPMKEYIILGVIEWVAYILAYEKVGKLYGAHAISGRMEGSLCHWGIRILYFIGIWAAVRVGIWCYSVWVNHRIIAIIIIGMIGMAYAGWRLWHEMRQRNGSRIHK